MNQKGIWNDCKQNETKMKRFISEYQNKNNLREEKPKDSSNPMTSLEPSLDSCRCGDG